MSEWQDDQLYEVEGAYLNELQGRVRELVDSLEQLAGSAQQVVEQLSAGQSPDAGLPALREHIARARQILDRKM